MTTFFVDSSAIVKRYISEGRFLLDQEFGPTSRW